MRVSPVRSTAAHSDSSKVNAQKETKTTQANSSQADTLIDLRGNNTTTPITQSNRVFALPTGLGQGGNVGQVPLFNPWVNMFIYYQQTQQSQIEAEKEIKEEKKIEETQELEKIELQESSEHLAEAEEAKKVLSVLALENKALTEEQQTLAHQQFVKSLQANNSQGTEKTKQDDLGKRSNNFQDKLSKTLAKLNENMAAIENNLQYSKLPSLNQIG